LHHRDGCEVDYLLRARAHGHLSPLDFSSPPLHANERVSFLFTRDEALFEIELRDERKAKGAVD
jgi:hypothetical protein